jgi:ribosomal protein S27E
MLNAQVCIFVWFYLKMKWNLNLRFLVGCVKITTVFSHAQTVVLCVGCNMVLCQPTGGLARVTTGMYFFISNLYQNMKTKKTK